MYVVYEMLIKWFDKRLLVFKNDRSCSENDQWPAIILYMYICTYNCACDSQ